MAPLNPKCDLTSAVSKVTGPPIRRLFITVLCGPRIGSYSGGIDSRRLTDVKNAWSFTSTLPLQQAHGRLHFTFNPSSLTECVITSPLNSFLNKLELHTSSLNNRYVAADYIVFLTVNNIIS
jgi:hypothetical protein